MSGPKFCSNCGEKIDKNLEIDECPKCHSALHEHSYHIDSPPRFVQQLPYKSPGTTALIAFLGGLFALPGIGHMYVRKVKRGIVILIGGLILYALVIVMIMSVISFQQFLSSEISSEITTNSAAIWLQIAILMLVFGIAYIVLLIWQIFDARKLAKKFNETVKTTGEEPW